MKIEDIKNIKTQAGYKYLYFDNSTGEHMLYNTETKTVEVFIKSKNFSGWGLKYKNTDLEFCSSWEGWRLERFIQGLNAIFNYGEQHPGFKKAYRLLRYTFTPERWARLPKKFLLQREKLVKKEPCLAGHVGITKKGLYRHNSITGFNELITKEGYFTGKSPYEI